MSQAFQTIIEGGIPTEALLAQIAVSKYADGLPLFRQEAIYARDKVELSRSLMAQWMGKVGFELKPLADYILERIKQGERVKVGQVVLTLQCRVTASGLTQHFGLSPRFLDYVPLGGVSAVVSYQVRQAARAWDGKPASSAWSSW